MFLVLNFQPLGEDHIEGWQFCESKEKEFVIEKTGLFIIKRLFFIIRD